MSAGISAVAPHGCCVALRRRIVNSLAFGVFSGWRPPAKNRLIGIARGWACIGAARKYFGQLATSDLSQVQQRAASS
eukprot:9079860-Pyramimonas_sp.AAC.1